MKTNCFTAINLDSEKQHSTCHAIISLVEKVSKAYTGKIVVVVFLDLKKHLTQLITQYY